MNTPPRLSGKDLDCINAGHVEYIMLYVACTQCHSSMEWDTRNFGLGKFLIQEELC